METLSPSPIFTNSFAMTKPKLLAAGALGMFIEALIPAIPFGILTSTVLIAAMVHQHHWNTTAKATWQIHFSWVTMITGVSTVLVGLGLDILRVA